MSQQNKDRFEQPKTEFRPKILLCGACLSGNMGGQALYASIVDNLKSFIGNCQITVLSKYPADDLEPCRSFSWQMVAFPTYTQLIYAVLLSPVYQLCRILRLPKKWIMWRVFEAFEQSDVLIDLSGISFTDDRPFTGLLINSLWLVPALVTQTPFVKASQAMGPFNMIHVRLISRYFLSRAVILIARGCESYNHLKKLLPEANIYELPDVAFSLESASDSSVGEALVSAGLTSGEPYIVCGPSYVVDELMNKRGGEGRYSQILAKAVDSLVEMTGHQILLIPHERAHIDSKWDDLHVCKAIYTNAVNRKMIKILDQDYPANLLKAIIAGAEIAIGSRFHFMVAAMSTCVPGLAIAWSHKYIEMMRMLGQEKFVMRFNEISENQLTAKISQLWVSRNAVRGEIENRLPVILQKARQNSKLIRDYLAANFNKMD